MKKEIPVCEIVVNNKKFYSLNEEAFYLGKRNTKGFYFKTNKGKEYKSFCINFVKDYITENFEPTEYILDNILPIIFVSEKIIKRLFEEFKLGDDFIIVNDEYEIEKIPSRNLERITYSEYVVQKGFYYRNNAMKILPLEFKRIDDDMFNYTYSLYGYGNSKKYLFSQEQILEMLKIHTYEEIYFIQKQKQDEEEKKQLDEYRKIEDPIERQIKTKEVEIFYDCSEEVKSVIRAKNIISPLEQMILIRLFNAPFSIKPQELLLNKYKVDFLIDEDIVIEIDGYKYHKDEKQMLKDYKRTRELQLAGYSVFRFLGKEVKNWNGFIVAKEICRIVKNKRDIQKNN